jgi:hypothetical protein
MGFDGSVSLSQFASLGEGAFSSAGPASRFVVLRDMLVGERDLNSDSWPSEVGEPSWKTLLEGSLADRLDAEGEDDWRLIASQYRRSFRAKLKKGRSAWFQRQFWNMRLNLNTATQINYLVRPGLLKNSRTTDIRSYTKEERRLERGCGCTSPIWKFSCEKKACPSPPPLRATSF